jgi:hypothetical protein
MRISSSALLLVSLVGCTSTPDEMEPTVTPTPSDESDEPEPMPTRPACDAQVSLYGASDSATPTSVPFAIQSSDGVNLCLELDARDNKRVAHFAASTQQEFGTNTSMFQLALLDKDGVTLQEGWDVTLGDSPPMAFANLEHDVTEGSIVEVTLHIVAKCVPLGTTIDLALFEPHK